VTPRLRIAHVVLQLRTGGMEKVLAELARHADRDAHDLHFVCLGDTGPVADEIAALGWPVTVLAKPRGLRPSFVLKLARLFTSLGTDVVHTHNNDPLLYAAPAARIAGVPVLIQTRHGQAVGTSRKHRTAVRLASLLARRVVCVSDDSRQVAEREGIAGKKLLTVHNGIDTRRFDFTGPRRNGPAVMVARMVPAKGGDVLLRAVQQVLRTHPDFRLLMAGDGPALPELIRLADELGIARSVQFLGEVSNVPAVLASSSLFVLPSHSEGVSLTVLEAMARGLPVVTTRVGGSPEVVNDPATGLLVPAGDADALASALVRVWSDPQTGERMGRAGRERVEQAFDVRTMTRRYEALYHELLASTGRGRAGRRTALPVAV
jgi:glycosyltransferase involved in cell wall biosynthesis